MKSPISWLVVVVALVAGAVQLQTVATQAPAAKPEALTELETLKLETITLQSQLTRALAEKADCYAALGPVQAQANSAAVQRQIDAFKAKVEVDHPGFVLDLTTGKLVPKPAPKAEPKKDGGV